MKDDRTLREREIEATIRALRDEADAIDHARREQELPSELGRFYVAEVNNYGRDYARGAGDFGDIKSRQFWRVAGIGRSESGTPHLLLVGYEVFADSVRILPANTWYGPASARADFKEINEATYRGAFADAISGLVLP